MIVEVDCRGLSLVVSAAVGRGGNFATKLVLTGLSLWLGSVVTALSVTLNHKSRDILLFYRAYALQMGIRY